MSLNVKQLSNLLFAFSFICALLMLIDKTFGYRMAIQTAFLVSGGIALILGLVTSRMEAYKDDFNVLFWLGSLIMFIGFMMKMYYFPESTYVLIAGMAISAIANFYNPFQSSKDREDELLDQ
ncbi:MAG: hypothetical protein HYZ43_09950 [Flavobacteriia bacterium]|nr:hypothetical protein [Flavobacteriia bacterium]